MTKQVHIIVKGKVQGVWFRDYTRKKALSLGLKGTVRNRSDGSVEIYAGGDSDSIEEFKNWCWEGSPNSHVVDVVANEVSGREFQDFRVLY